MRGAVRNKERWKGRHAPTQDPSTNHLLYRTAASRPAPIAAARAADPGRRREQSLLWPGLQNLGAENGFERFEIGRVRTGCLVLVDIVEYLHTPFQSKKIGFLGAENRFCPPNPGTRRGTCSPKPAQYERVLEYLSRYGIP